MKRIYLDYAATTPVDKRVEEKIITTMSANFGNPSSLHGFGQDARVAIDTARESVASFLNAKEREIIFTNSATVANNVAILGVLKNKKNPHIITTSFEHKAVLEPLLSSNFDVSYLPVYNNGIVKPEDVLPLIKEETAIISVGYVNSEVGTIQPIEKIGMLIREENNKRKEKIVFHTDAVQAVNYLSCDVKKLGVDILTLSGHKIYGPKGTGALYVKEEAKLNPIVFGASQERGIFPGTENTFAIVGLGFALEEVLKDDREKVRVLRDKIVSFILNNIAGSSINGDMEKRVANNVNVSFSGVEGESLMFALDNEGVAVSTGSACASSSLNPSYVLLAMGVSREKAHSSIRISLGRFTTEKEVDYFLEKLSKIIIKLRKISGR